MKVIDLLNKIANNEELPKKIKWSGVKFYLKDKIKYYDYENDIGCSLFRHDTEFYSSLDMLNDEIEIIGEDKEIEEIKTTINYYINYEDERLNEDISFICKQLILHTDKINELIKAVNELKKGK